MAKLTQLDENLWYSDQILKSGLLTFGIRMVVVRLASGGLWLHSPIKFDNALEKDLKEIGKVEHIVAPNCLHHLNVKSAKELFSNAKLWAAPGLTEKRHDIEFDGVLSEEKQYWASDLEQLFIKGMPKINEFVFFHKPSSSLICSDFVFNVQTEPGFLMRIMWRIAGAYKKFGQDRLWRMMIQDKEEMIDSIKKVLKWDFKRIIMAHGEIIDCTSDQLCEVLEKQYKLSLSSS